MSDAPPDYDETRDLLLLQARGKFGKIPAILLVEHLLRMTQEADLPVRKAALEALRRRFEFARQSELGVIARPRKGLILGEYSTGSVPRLIDKASRGVKPRRGASAGRSRSARLDRVPRPYVTRLDSLEPLRGSCGCPDFVRSSLGLCKHLLGVLDDLYAAKQLPKASRPPRNGRAGATPRLEWDPVRPLVGAGDRLLGLRLRDATKASSTWGFTDGLPLIDLLADQGARAQFVKALLRAHERGSLEIEPAGLTLLAEEMERSLRVVEQERALEQVLGALDTLKRKLYPYQRVGVERFVRAGRLLLADDMGLGKTTQAIAACHALHESKRVRRGILVVPAALASQWQREWAGTTHLPLTAIDGSADERARHYSKKHGLLVMSYERLLRDFTQVRAFDPELVVLDEAQRIKNWATKSAMYVKALQPRYRLVLTGTPMENRFDELASIVDFVDDVALAPKWRLTPWHTVVEGDGAAGRAGARNLDTLRQRLSSCMLRRVRREVLADLPSRTDTDVPVELTPAQWSEHETLREPIARLMSIARRRPLLQKEFLSLMQLLTTQRIICNGLGQLHFEETWAGYGHKRPSENLVSQLGMPKLMALRDLVRSLALEQRRKSVIFSQWRSMLRLSEWAVRDVLAEAGLRAVFFTGAENQKTRTRAVVDFHDDPEVAVMFLSDAGGVGLNLQKAASACINLELPWNPAVLEQRIGRIYRLGQKQPIDTFRLVSQGGIEERIASVIAGKKAVFSSLFDGDSNEVRFDGKGGFLEGIARLVEPSEPPPPLSTDAGDSDGLREAAIDETGSGEANPGDAEESRADGGDRSSPATVQAARSLHVERLDDGRLRVEVAPELAGPLAQLLESLAETLRTGPSSS